MSRADRHRRRQGYARRRFRAQRWAYLKANRRDLVQVVVVVIFVIALTSLYGNWNPYVKGFFHASLVWLLLGLVSFAFLMGTGSFHQLAGAWGEDNTREQLEEAHKSGHVLADVSSIELGAFDIDHLVFTPGGVLALESKWHFRRVPDQTIQEDVAQAKESARKAALVLKSEDIKRPHDVVPVVVLWGGGRRAFPSEGRTVDGVFVVPGDALPAWLASRPRGLFGPDYALETAERVQAFADSRERRAVVVKY